MALAAMGVRRATASGAVRLYMDAANLPGFIYDPTSGRLLACKPRQSGDLSELCEPPRTIREPLLSLPTYGE